VTLWKLISSSQWPFNDQCYTRFSKPISNLPILVILLLTTVPSCLFNIEKQSCSCLVKPCKELIAMGSLPLTLPMYSQPILFYLQHVKAQPSLFEFHVLPSSAIGRIRTLDLRIMRRVSYQCAQQGAQPFVSFVSSQTCQLFLALGTHLHYLPEGWVVDNAYICYGWFGQGILTEGEGSVQVTS
jgi:hypothetical protein